MNDLDRYLLPTETTEVVVRRHWASQVLNGVIAAALVLLSLLILIYLAAGQLFSLLGTVLLLGTLGWFGWVVGDWYVERFVITDKRVLLITGLLTKRVAIMPLSKVTDLTYERSLPGRLLGYGVFVVESAGQHQALSRIDYLPHPDELYQQVSALLFGPRDRSDRSARSGREGPGEWPGGSPADGVPWPPPDGGPQPPVGGGRPAGTGPAPGYATGSRQSYPDSGQTERLPVMPPVGGHPAGPVQDQSTRPLPRLR